MPAAPKLDPLANAALELSPVETKKDRRLKRSAQTASASPRPQTPAPEKRSRMNKSSKATRRYGATRQGGSPCQ